MINLGGKRFKKPVRLAWIFFSGLLFGWLFFAVCLQSLTAIGTNLGWLCFIFVAVSFVAVSAAYECGKDWAKGNNVKHLKANSERG